MPVLESFLADLSQSQPAWRVGATVFLPRYSSATCVNYLGRLGRGACYAIADPETHRLEEPFDQRGRGRRHHAYLAESDPVANRARFVENVLRAQLQAGTDLLVSPWLTHGVSLSTRNYRATLRFAEEAHGHSLAAGRHLVFGFAVTEAVMRDDEARDDLMDSIVELPDGHVYLRLRITPPNSYAQYANPDVLRGLRSFVEGLAANGRRTFLPQMGLPGWLMTAFGALAYGSGISASMQRHVPPVDGFAAQPLDWYFEPGLLGFVLRTELPSIAQMPNHMSCGCPYCAQLTFGSGQSWDRDTAGLHYLWWCARLADEVRTAVTPQQAVRDRLTAAQALWNQLRQASVSLDPRSEPRHLAAWLAVTA